MPRLKGGSLAAVECTPCSHPVSPLLSPSCLSAVARSLFLSHGGGSLSGVRVGASGSGREEEKKKEKKEERRREKEKTGGNGDPERKLGPLARKNFRPFIQDAYEKL